MMRHRSESAGQLSLKTGKGEAGDERQEVPGVEGVAVIVALAPDAALPEVLRHRTCQVVVPFRVGGRP